MLHLQLLGQLVVQDEDGNDLTPPGARERNGLATLAVVSPEGLSTERIAAELYRERDTVDPRNAVQAMVSRLRRGLGRRAGSIETTANGYRLVDVRIDIDDAERLLLAAMAETDPQVASQLLEQAAGLWHGPTLDGVPGELVDSERLRIDNLRADAEDALFERRLAVGHDQTLVASLEAAVRDQPLREKRWELLMLTLYREGRQADALRAFQRARSLLSDHLGLEPGPSLSRLEQRILAHDPALDAPVAEQRPTTEPGNSATVTDRAGGSTPNGAEAVASTPANGGIDRSPPSGTVSVLMCDVEGSVKRWESDPTTTAEQIAELHEVWGERIAANGGHLVKSTGDGVLAAFPTAGTAVVAAAEAMRLQNQGSLQVKAAIHTGSLEPIDGDYRGPVVNRCARLLDLANGGQILASGTTAELARPELAAGDRDGSPGSGAGPIKEHSGGTQLVSMKELGAQWLRDVSEPLPVWQVDGPGIQSTFPPLAPRESITLPRLRSELIGRDELVDRVTKQVDGNNLVTLLGPGGIGKTSLALAAGWKVSSGRPLAFVDLARVSDPAAVIERILEALSLGEVEHNQDPLDRIADRLRSNTDLVVIDNAEHVLDEVATAIDHVLHYDLKGSFLVTSRQPLGLPDEHIIGVPPLNLPEDGDDLSATGRSPSVRLFLDRAKLNRPDFKVQNGLLPVVAHICRRLDGIPLAIELAAGRTSLLSIDDIAARLDDQLRLLRQVRSSRDRRHRSLEVVVGWSVDQLSPEARDVFARLSVMAGSFGIDGVEAMLEHCGLDRADPLEALDELREASLINVEAGGSRFRMLEPIRQVAAAELTERGQELATRRAHALWLTGMAVDAHARRDETRADALKLIDLEADQVQASVAWMAETGETELAAEIAVPISWWFLTRDANAGERLLGRLLAIMNRDTDPLGWALVVMGLGIATAAHPRSDVQQASLDALEIMDQADHPDRGIVRLAAAYAQTTKSNTGILFRLLEEAEQLISSDDVWASALLDMSLMIVHSLDLLISDADIDPEPAIAKGRRAVKLFRRLQEDWALGATLGEMGRLFQSLDRLAEAEECYTESLELFAGSGYHGVHYVLSELGRLATAKNEHELARQYHEESIRLARQDGSSGCMAMSLAGMAHAAEGRGEHDLSLTLYRSALDLSEQASLVEHGHGEWRDAVKRLETLVAELD